MANETVEKAEVVKDEKGPGDIVQAFLNKKKIALRVVPKWDPVNGGQNFILGFTIVADYITEDDTKPAA